MFAGAGLDITPAWTDKVLCLGWEVRGRRNVDNDVGVDNGFYMSQCQIPWLASGACSVGRKSCDPSGKRGI